MDLHWGKVFPSSTLSHLLRKQKEQVRAFTLLSLGLRVLKNEAWGSKGHQKEKFCDSIYGKVETTLDWILAWQNSKCEHPPWLRYKVQRKKKDTERLTQLCTQSLQIVPLVIGLTRLGWGIVWKNHFPLLPFYVLFLLSLPAHSLRQAFFSYTGLHCLEYPSCIPPCLPTLAKTPQEITLPFCNCSGTLSSMNNKLELSLCSKDTMLF